jgi:hypothetical protein
MVVPMGASAADRRIRVHEMAHVRWSPAGFTPASLPPGTTWQTFNAVEDCRLHKRLAEVGLGDTLSTPVFGDDEWGVWAESFSEDCDRASEPDYKPHWTPLEVARMAASVHGTAEAERFASLADEWGYGFVHSLLQPILDETVLKRRPAFQRTIEAAEAIDRLFNELSDLPQGLQEKVRQYAAPDGPDGSEWGDMTIQEMPLRVPLPRRMASRKMRASDKGAIPRYWHRMPVDSRVFGRKQNRPAGGTVLLDQSGSMGLSIPEVIELMSRFPAVTIATYAGEEYTGELRVIARNGKRASDEDCYHPLGGNTVDGPALEWLCDQPAPRVWISDGYVVGKGGATSLDLLLECEAIRKRGGIIQVERMSDLLDGEE